MLSTKTTQIKKAKTKAYNLSLDTQAVEEAKKAVPKISFSQYLSDLIKKDLEERKQVKTMQQIFGKDFQPLLFKNKQEEQDFYELISLTDYALHEN
jgi:post-segregation antitoxin (ccd killing protein)